MNNATVTLSPRNANLLKRDEHCARKVKTWAGTISFDKVTYNGESQTDASHDTNGKSVVQYGPRLSMKAVPNQDIEC